MHVLVVVCCRFTPWPTPVLTCGVYHAHGYVPAIKAWHLKTAVHLSTGFWLAVASCTSNEDAALLAEMGAGWCSCCPAGPIPGLRTPAFPNNILIFTVRSTCLGPCMLSTHWKRVSIEHMHCHWMLHLCRCVRHPPIIDGRLSRLRYCLRRCRAAVRV